MDTLHRYLVQEALEHYRSGWITRRDFMRRAAAVGLSAAAAGAMAATVHPATVRAAPPRQMSPFSVPEGDPSIGTEWVTYAAADGTPLRAYMAWPSPVPLDGSRPAVAIYDGPAGLNDMALDLARRFAKEGYVAVAPDLVSRGGRATSEMTDQQSRSAFASIGAEQLARDMAAALEFASGHPAVDGSKLAAIGFCASGSIVWRLTTLYPRLRAAAPFYGSNPPLGDVPNIRAAVFGVYGELDSRLNEGIPAIESAMTAAGVTHLIKVYPNSMHAFFSDYSPRSYNPDTASEAWFDTLKWFSEQLDLPTAWM
jgi:carboxymethylenebutenolidase